MLFHLRHAAKHGHFGLPQDSGHWCGSSCHSSFHELNLPKMWIGFGSGKKIKTFPFITSLDRFPPLPFIHGMWCSINNLWNWEKTSWNVWVVFFFPEITDTVAAVTQDPSNFTLDSLHKQRLECLCWCTAKTVDALLSLNPTSCCSALSSNLLSPSHELSMPCSSTWGEHYSLRLSSGMNLSANFPTFQARINGGGSGMTEARLGYHTWLIYYMPAKDTHCCSTVAAWLLPKETASVTELHFAVVRCANVKRGAKQCWSLGLRAIIQNTDRHLKTMLHF